MAFVHAEALHTGEHVEHLPGGGISVEMTDNFLALLDLAEEVLLTWNFSVLTVAFSQ